MYIRIYISTINLGRTRPQRDTTEGAARDGLRLLFINHFLLPVGGGGDGRGQGGPFAETFVGRTLHSGYRYMRCACNAKNALKTLWRLPQLLSLT